MKHTVEEKAKGDGIFEGSVEKIGDWCQYRGAAWRIKKYGIPEHRGNLEGKPSLKEKNTIRVQCENTCTLCTVKYLWVIIFQFYRTHVNT